MLAAQCCPSARAHSPGRHRLPSAHSRIVGGAGPPAVLCGPSTDPDLGAVTGRADVLPVQVGKRSRANPLSPAPAKPQLRRNDLLPKFCYPQRYQAPWNSRNNVRIKPVTWVELWVFVIACGSWSGPQKPFFPTGNDRWSCGSPGRFPRSRRSCRTAPTGSCPFPEQTPAQRSKPTSGTGRQRCQQTLPVRPRAAS
jgi:hypothetical protein